VNRSYFSHWMFWGLLKFWKCSMNIWSGFFVPRLKFKTLWGVLGVINLYLKVLASKVRLSSNSTL
jgi:hypothetical protein